MTATAAGRTAIAAARISAPASPRVFQAASRRRSARSRLARKRPGVTPTRALKARVRWLWSAKPQSSATSPGVLPAAASGRARRGPAGRQPGVRRQAGLLAERADQVEAAEPGNAGQRGQIDVLGIVARRDSPAPAPTGPGSTPTGAGSPSRACRDRISASAETKRSSPVGWSPPPSASARRRTAPRLGIVDHRLGEIRRRAVSAGRSARRRSPGSASTLG